MVKHDFLNLKSCNDDKEWLTKTLRAGKETSVRQPGPKPRRMLVVERWIGSAFWLAESLQTGTRGTVSAKPVFIV